MAVVGLTRPASGFGKGTAMFATAATIELNGFLLDKRRGGVLDSDLLALVEFVTMNAICHLYTRQIA